MRRNGWTLVELLVAIAIVAALAAIATMVVPDAKIRAQQVQSTANLRSLCIANLAYAVDHGTYCPASDRRNLVRWHGARASIRDRFDPTKGYLSDYLGKSRQVIACPRFINMVEKGSWESGSGGYGYNATYIGGTPASRFRPARPSEIHRPGATIMFATTALAKSTGLQEYPFAEPFRWVDPNWKLQGPLQPSVHFRFHGRALIGWCDGHITAEFPSEFPATNFYGGDNKASQIGFPGPREDNGWFSSRR
jgi:prepilin-type N-terminal cleavage/methylation domain-containing protein